MVKDERYKTGKKLIESGYFESFRQIFDHIPRSRVFKDMGMNYQRFAKMVENPTLFTLLELQILAGLFDVDPKIIIDMAWQQHLKDLAGKKRRRFPK